MVAAASLSAARFDVHDGVCTSFKPSAPQVSLKDVNAMQCSGSQRGQWDQLGMIVYMWERWSDGEGGASEMGSGYELQWDAVALAPVCIQQSRHVGTHTHIHTLIWRNKCTLEMEQKSVGGFGSCCRWLCGLFEWEVGGVEREWQREREGQFCSWLLLVAC